MNKERYIHPDSDEMLLSADRTSYGLVTDNFGKLTLTLYAGKEHAGKTATVYQLHGENKGLGLEYSRSSQPLI